MPFPSPGVLTNPGIEPRSSALEADSLLTELQRKPQFPLEFLDESDSKEFACNAGDSCWICGSGRSPREGNGYPLQYSCLENPMDKGGWQARVHGFAKNQTRLSDFTFIKSTRMGLGLLCSLIYPKCFDHCLAHECKGVCVEGTSIY